MKLSYVVPYTRYQNSTGLTSGVEKKIQYQEKALENLSISVNRCELIIDSRSINKFLRSIYTSYRRLQNVFNDNETEILYCRNLFPYLSYSLLIGKNKNKKVVFEIQDIAPKLEKITRNKSILANMQSAYILLMEHFLGKYILRHASGGVAVTSEIAEFYQKRGLMPTLTLGNGISTADIPLKKAQSFGYKLHVLSVAVIQNYHGIDRFIRGIHKYYSSNNEIQIVLHVVGDGPELLNLKKLTQELDLLDNVIFHGYKSGKELDEMFDMCHIALGSLGGFRINMHEMSSLKSGEYCARGMPFVIAAKAIDFPDDWPYILHVPETEESINMDDIIMFANRVMADTNHPKVMREYAEQNLDWSVKMKKLKEFLENL